MTGNGKRSSQLTPAHDRLLDILADVLVTEFLAEKLEPSNLVHTMAGGEEGPE